MGERVEIVVCASGYAPADLVEVRRYGAKLITSAERLPFGVARNRGASIATGDLLLFLDDDNVIDAACIDALAACLREAQDVAMVGPLMYYGSQPSRLWCAGIRRSRVLGRTYKVTRVEEPMPKLLPSLDFPNCFMVRRSDFVAVGQFDEKLLPAHFGEADLGARLREAGCGKSVCVTKARVWHFIERELRRYLSLHDPEWAYQIGRGRAVFAALHGDPVAWIVYLLAGQFLFTAFYLGPGLGFTWSRRRQMTMAYLRGVVDGLFIGVKVRSGRGSGAHASAVE
jgi:GT2 family glycosyltransferase